MSVRFAKREFDDLKNIYVERKVEEHKIQLHGHDFYELEVIMNGNTPTTINGHSLNVSAGTVLFMTPEDFHAYPDMAGMDLYKIQFADAVVSDSVLRLLVDCKERVYTPCEKAFEYICTMLELMLEIDRCDPDHTDIKTRLLESVLLLLYRTAKHETKQPRQNDTIDMQKALLYINAHFHENPSLEDIASVLHINQRYFCTKFKEYTGETYKNYLRTKKLRYARRLVLATALPIIEVAAQSGYATQTHFNREFKNYYGISPMEYRRNKGNKK